MMSNCLHQLSHTRFIVLAETITGTAVAIDFIDKYSSLLMKGIALNLEQALTRSSHRLACREVSDQRVIVDREQEVLTIHIQRRSKRRWIADDDGGGVRYLTGVLRDDIGRYLSLCKSDDLSGIDQIRTLLPLCYQALLLPACDDWHAIERGDL
jgi:hypothetical protein